MSKKAIGIDLGTSTSCVSVVEGGKPTVLVNTEGRNTTPSVVLIKDGEIKVGDSASRQRVVYPNSCVVWVKRLMGLTYDEAKDIIPRLPYKVVNSNGKPRIEIDGKLYSPEEISAQILMKMKKTAEDYLGSEVTDAVITCPAWFDNNAREATKLAGELAKLKVLRVINEPTAAILASSINTKENKTVLVADIGGGTTDFSVCDVSEGIVEVLASRGDIFLGGADFDNAILNWMINTFKDKEGIDLSSDAQAKQRLLEEAEKAKISFSNGNVYDFNIPYITATQSGPKHFIESLTKAKFEQLTSSLVDRIIEKAKDAMNAAKNPKLTCILLVGGQSRSTAIREALSKEFGVELNHGINPDEAVALGASTLADTLANGVNDTSILLVDKTSLRFGIETMGGIMTSLIEEDTTIPCRKSETFSTASDNQSVVTINVLQGNRSLAKDNKQIGIFNLDGIPMAPRGIPQIEVTFDIDANGIMTVSAKDKGTGKEQHITIQSKSSMSTEEIEKAKKDAEMFAEADKKARDEAETINKAESIIFSVEKTLKDTKDKLTNDEISEVEALIKEMREAVNAKDINKISELEKIIQDKMDVLAQKIYVQPQTDSTNTDTVKNDNNSETVDFEEVN